MGPPDDGVVAVTGEHAIRKPEGIIVMRIPDIELELSYRKNPFTMRAKTLRLDPAAFSMHTKYQRDAIEAIRKALATRGVGIEHNRGDVTVYPGSKGVLG